MSDSESTGTPPKRRVGNLSDLASSDSLPDGDETPQRPVRRVIKRITDSDDTTDVKSDSVPIPAAAVKRGSTQSLKGEKRDDSSEPRSPKTDSDASDASDSTESTSDSTSSDAEEGSPDQVEAPVAATAAAAAPPPSDAVLEKAAPETTPAETAGQTSAEEPKKVEKAEKTDEESEEEEDEESEETEETGSAEKTQGQKEAAVTPESDAVETPPQVAETETAPPTTDAVEEAAVVATETAVPAQEEATAAKEVEAEAVAVEEEGEGEEEVGVAEEASKDDSSDLSSAASDDGVQDKHNVEDDSLIAPATEAEVVVSETADIVSADQEAGQEPTTSGQPQGERTSPPPLDITVVQNPAFPLSSSEVYSESIDSLPLRKPTSSFQLSKDPLSARSPSPHEPETFFSVSPITPCKRQNTADSALEISASIAGPGWNVSRGGSEMSELTRGVSRGIGTPDQNHLMGSVTTNPEHLRTLPLVPSDNDLAEAHDRSMIALEQAVADVNLEKVGDTTGSSASESSKSSGEHPESSAPLPTVHMPSPILASELTTQTPTPEPDIVVPEPEPAAVQTETEKPKKITAPPLKRVATMESKAGSPLDTPLEIRLTRSATLRMAEQRRKAQEIDEYEERTLREMAALHENAKLSPTRKRTDREAKKKPADAPVLSLDVDSDSEKASTKQGVLTPVVTPSAARRTSVQSHGSSHSGHQYAPPMRGVTVIAERHIPPEEAKLRTPKHRSSTLPAKPKVSPIRMPTPVSPAGRFSANASLVVEGGRRETVERLRSGGQSRDGNSVSSAHQLSDKLVLKEAIRQKEAAREERKNILSNLDDFLSLYSDLSPRGKPSKEETFFDNNGGWETRRVLGKALFSRAGSNAAKSPSRSPEVSNKPYSARPRPGNAEIASPIQSEATKLTAAVNMRASEVLQAVQHQRISPPRQAPRTPPTAVKHSQQFTVAKDPAPRIPEDIAELKPESWRDAVKRQNRRPMEKVGDRLFQHSQDLAKEKKMWADHEKTKTMAKQTIEQEAQATFAPTLSKRSRSIEAAVRQGTNTLRDQQTRLLPTALQSPLPAPRRNNESKPVFGRTTVREETPPPQQRSFSTPISTRVAKLAQHRRPEILEEIGREMSELKNAWSREQPVDERLLARRQHDLKGKGLGEYLYDHSTKRNNRAVELERVREEQTRRDSDVGQYLTGSSVVIATQRQRERLEQLFHLLDVEGRGKVTEQDIAQADEALRFVKSKVNDPREAAILTALTEAAEILRTDPNADYTKESFIAALDGKMSRCGPLAFMGPEAARKQKIPDPSFNPKILEKSKKLAKHLVGGKEVHSRLYGVAAVRESRREQYAKKKDEMEMDGATFQPKVNRRRKVVTPVEDDDVLAQIDNIVGEAAAWLNNVGPKDASPQTAPRTETTHTDSSKKRTRSSLKPKAKQKTRSPSLSVSVSPPTPITGGPGKKGRKEAVDRPMRANTYADPLSLQKISPIRSNSPQAVQERVNDTPISPPPPLASDPYFAAGYPSGPSGGMGMGQYTPLQAHFQKLHSEVTSGVQQDHPYHQVAQPQMQPSFIAPSISGMEQYRETEVQSEVQIEHRAQVAMEGQTKKKQKMKRRKQEPPISLMTLGNASSEQLAEAGKALMRQQLDRHRLRK